ncbi:tyrosine-type recombinase/integrase [Vallitalea okinawensis]|uniref:tyrosine-type recombinase/integrase n=1 Tax=Vallitalea okinawensis TaxID=2078660 RepID=UPI000CFE0949|nr:tyrosine-type recombinase/integrase [Vallitalea okinawensis]
MITVSNAIELFLMEQEIRQNSIRTYEYYQQKLKDFEKYIGSDTDINTVKKPNVDQYQLHITKRPKWQNTVFHPEYKKPIKKITVQSYIRAIRAFFNWIYAEGYIDTDVGKRIKLPRVPKKHVDILDPSEFDILLNSFNARTETGMRNKCLVLLMLDSGLRKTESINLLIEDVSLVRGTIYVRGGKGDKDRIVPMGLYTKKALHKYMSFYRSMSEYPTSRLFLNRDRSPFTDSAFKSMMARMKKKSGIKRLHAHMLRHTFATYYLMNDGDIISLQMILGHTTSEMTRKYLHLASAYTINRHKERSPVDNVIIKKKNYV